MADEGNVITDLDLDSPAANGEDTGPAAGVISQYVKDLSVENPNSPASFQWQDPPQLDVQLNVEADQIDPEIHEVKLRVQLTSKQEAGTAFIVELTYCGLIGMRGLPADAMHAFTYAEAPRILFPFARRIISDAVRDAGFPPVMLDPIDFNGLYAQQLAQAQQTAEGEPAGNA